MSVKKKPLVVVTRKLPDSIETRMRELFDARLNLDDVPMTPEQIAEAVRNADILVVATGKRNIVTADMVKPGAVVIDVGMNRDDEGKLCGDVDFANVKEVAGYITPVPGGVGPMTITMLLVNTIEAAERS